MRADDVLDGEGKIKVETPFAARIANDVEYLTLTGAIPAGTPVTVRAFFYPTRATKRENLCASVEVDPSLVRALALWFPRRAAPFTIGVYVRDLESA